LSNTGTYVWRNGRLEKISNRTPKLGYITEVAMPRLKGRIHRPFATENICGKNTEYRTRRQLYDDMKRNKVSYAEDKPSRPSPDPEKRKESIAKTLDREASKRGFRWRV
jgi:hypothetical protein